MTNWKGYEKRWVASLRFYNLALSARTEKHTETFADYS
jgi:hypothetical protein